MEVSRNWRLQKIRYKLLGNQCESGHKNFPPRAICPYCADEAKILYELNKIRGLFSSKLSVTVENSE